MKINPEQCRAARALLDISQAELASKVGVSETMIQRFELGKHVTWDDFIQKHLELAGVRFLFDEGRPSGVCFSRFKPAFVEEEEQPMWPLHFRVARAWLGWNYRHMVVESGVAESTVRDFEKDRRLPQHGSLIKMELAIKTLGIRFMFDAGENPIGIRVLYGQVAALAA